MNEVARVTRSAERLSIIVSEGAGSNVTLFCAHQIALTPSCQRHSMTTQRNIRFFVRSSKINFHGRNGRKIK